MPFFIFVHSVVGLISSSFAVFCLLLLFLAIFCIYKQSGKGGCEEMIEHFFTAPLRYGICLCSSSAARRSAKAPFHRKEVAPQATEDKGVRSFLKFSVFLRAPPISFLRKEPYVTGFTLMPPVRILPGSFAQETGGRREGSGCLFLPFIYTKRNPPA